MTCYVRLTIIGGSGHVSVRHSNIWVYTDLLTSNLANLLIVNSCPRSNFFSLRVVNVWNAMSESVIAAPSVNSFNG